jgi:hypothetical protein
MQINKIQRPFLHDAVWRRKDESLSIGREARRNGFFQKHFKKHFKTFENNGKQPRIGFYEDTTLNTRKDEVVFA